MDTALLAVIGSLASLFFGYFSYKRGQETEAARVKKEYKDIGDFGGTLRTDLEYIKRRSEETLVELKDINKFNSATSERLTRVEESLKSAHNRINGILENCKEIQKEKKAKEGQQ